MATPPTPRAVEPTGRTKNAALSARNASASTHVPAQYMPRGYADHGMPLPTQAPTRKQESTATESRDQSHGNGHANQFYNANANTARSGVKHCMEHWRAALPRTLLQGLPHQLP